MKPTLIAVLSLVAWSLCFLGCTHKEHLEMAYPMASMLPTIEPGDLLVVETNAYRMAVPRRFDIVLFRSVEPGRNQEMIVRRVVGLPGEEIHIMKDQLLINGQVQDESFDHIRDHTVAFSSWVPRGCFFMLGDNRPYSRDSRNYGAIPFQNICGQVVAVHRGRTMISLK